MARNALVLACLLASAAPAAAQKVGETLPEPKGTLVEIGLALYEQRCGQCHARAEGESSFAPTLHKVIGRKAGSVEGFPYTQRISMLDLIWNEQSLWSWLQSTTFDTPLIALRHAGAKSPAEADALVAYLATLK